MNDHEDLGPPAVELKELDEAAGHEFLLRVRGRIHRRLFAADSADFAFRVFFEAMFDYLDLFMRHLTDLAGPPAKEKE